MLLVDTSREWRQLFLHFKPNNLWVLMSNSAAVCAIDRFVCGRYLLSVRIQLAMFLYARSRLMEEQDDRRYELTVGKRSKSWTRATE